jgi:hypothetical protein
MFTQYTHQLCSSLVNFHLLVILYGELLLKKDELLVWNRTNKYTYKYNYNNNK